MSMVGVPSIHWITFVGALVVGTAAPRAMAESVDAAVTPSAIEPSARARGMPGELRTRLASYIQSIQHSVSGLPRSFTQSVDVQLRDVAFTYDVAVAALVLAHAGALDAAHHALQTFRRMPLPSDQMLTFNTAYHVSTGVPTLEYRVHGGPIFWMAIALMRYGHAAGDAASFAKGVQLLEWARTRLPHREGGVAMSDRGSWRSVMSVENNWVYDAALRIATQHLPGGKPRHDLTDEQQGVRRWLRAHQTDRGWNDPVKALDVYTHALLVGPDAYMTEGNVSNADALAQWVKASVSKVESLFEVPGTALYDYTDARELRIIGRRHAGWLEGTEQLCLAYQTWAAWFEQRGDHEYAKTLRMKAALSHEQVLRYALPIARGTAIPNTDAPVTFLTFHDGWYARPLSEPALNGTSWAYLVEVGYNPFVTELPAGRARHDRPR